jgi:cellulose synthase/poly-beta-1,6-N-acetylglucosamine synthase-like glycosyltransferase
VGEGPSSWSDYFSQQLRWSRGTFEILTGAFWPRFHRLSAGAKLHYLLITTFYPSMALGWILGMIDAVLFLTFGVTGIVVPPQLWLALYVDATLFQLWVYVRNRKYNVSPFEPDGSPGLRGMVMSVLTSPIYAAGMIATILRRPARFVVTPKAVASTTDTLWTFWRHLMWAGLIGGSIVAAFVLGYANFDVLMWPALALLITLTPMVLAWLDKPETKPGAVPAPRVELPAELAYELDPERTVKIRAVA